MSLNEPVITVSGNVAAAPTLRLAGGAPVTSFRIGATPRRYDRATDSWSDAETLWFTVTAWRALAEHCVSSLSKGDRVLVTGRLGQSSWTGDDGVVRSGLEVDAATVGLDLSRGVALSARRSPGRAGEDVGRAPSAAADDPWRSTGEVDLDTGEVRLVAQREPDAVPDVEPEAGADGAHGAVDGAVDGAARPEPAGV